ncbi:MAG: hypothetical protein ACTSO3_17050, partial [Candidatus Heimdallarchaeaceae archaeon]
DNLAIQLALQDLIEVNEEQLEGIFNIPEGMTAWIPVTAGYYYRGGTGTGVGTRAPSFMGTPDVWEDRKMRRLSALLPSSTPDYFMSKMSISEDRLMRRVSALLPHNISDTNFETIPTRDDKSSLVPESIGVEVQNDINIEIPVYVNGELIAREVRKHFEQNFKETSRRTGIHSPNITYQ